MPRCFASPPSPSPRSRGCGPCRPTRSSSCESGPVGDRAFHVREADGEIALTMRNPRLVQVVPRWDAAEGELALAFPDGRRVAAPVVRGEAVSTAFYDGRPVPGRLVEGPFAAALSEHLGRAVQLVANDAGVVGGDDHPVTLMSDGSLAAVSDALDGARRRPAPLPDDDRGRGRPGVGGGRLGRSRGRDRYGHAARRGPHRALRGDDARPRRRPRRPADPARPRAACAASATSPSACGATSPRPASCGSATRSSPASPSAGAPTGSSAAAMATCRVTGSLRPRSVTVPRSAKPPCSPRSSAHVASVTSTVSFGLAREALHARRGVHGVADDGELDAAAAADGAGHHRARS